MHTYVCALIINRIDYRTYVLPVKFHVEENQKQILQICTYSTTVLYLLEPLLYSRESIVQLIVRYRTLRGVFFNTVRYGIVQYRYGTVLYLRLYQVRFRCSTVAK